jgi:hypothetical protein
VISGDNRFPAAAAHDELIGRSRQHLSKWLLEGRTDGASPCDFRQPISIRVLSGPRFFRGSDKGGTRIAVQIEDHRHRIEQVFAVIEPAFLLDGVLEISVPGSVPPDLGGSMSQAKIRAAPVRGKSDPAWLDPKRSIQPTVFVRRAVVVAEGDQGAQLERTRHFGWET